MTKNLIDLNKKEQIIFYRNLSNKDIIQIKEYFILYPENLTSYKNIFFNKVDFNKTIEKIDKEYKKMLDIVKKADKINKLKEEFNKIIKTLNREELYELLEVNNFKPLI